MEKVLKDALEMLTAFTASYVDGEPYDRELAFETMLAVNNAAMVLSRLAAPMTITARDFAAMWHKNTYNGEPYTKHLDDVWAILQAHGYCAPAFEVAAYLHDILEDTACTGEVIRDTIFTRYGPGDNFVLAIVEFCTDSEGSNRKERKEKTLQRQNFLLKQFNKEGYPPMSMAAIVKIADRIANMRMCCAFLGNKRLAKMYLKEAEAFRRALDYKEFPGPVKYPEELWKTFDKTLEGLAHVLGSKDDSAN